MWCTGLVAPWHVGSSRTRARTRVPRIGRRILNHCATREVQDLPFLSFRFCRDDNHFVPVLICNAFYCFVFSPVLNKGQCVTKYYRWMQKNGGYIWIQSSATIAINAKNANEKNIIWVNYLLRYILEFFFISISVIKHAAQW